MREIGGGINVIPDVHGRSFWRAAADLVPGRRIVFLGDYVDPFQNESISPEWAMEVLKEILSLKRSYPQEVTLLLGNHDLQYVWEEFPRTRHDSDYAAQYSSLFKANRDCFDLTASFRAKNRTVILTHAGITPGWLNECRQLFGIGEGPLQGELLNLAEIETPNKLWHSGDDTLLCETLSHVSKIRGGENAWGSMVWADVREMMAVPQAPGYLQVFGHTQQHEGPLFTDTFACIDCKRAFLLNRDGTLN